MLVPPVPPASSCSRRRTATAPCPTARAVSRAPGSLEGLLGGLARRRRGPFAEARVVGIAGRITHSRPLRLCPVDPHRPTSAGPQRRNPALLKALARRTRRPQAATSSTAAPSPRPSAPPAQPATSQSPPAARAVSGLGWCLRRNAFSHLGCPASGLRRRRCHVRLPVLSPPPRTWPAPLATGCAAGFAYNSTTLACDVCGAGNYCAGSGSTLTSAVRTVCGAFKITTSSLSRSSAECGEPRRGGGGERAALAQACAQPAVPGQ